MVGVLIAFPQLVTDSLEAKAEVDLDAIGQQMLQDLEQPSGGYGDAADESHGGEGAEGYDSESGYGDAPAGESSGSDAGGYGSSGGYGAGTEGGEAAPPPEDEPQGYGSEAPAK